MLHLGLLGLLIQNQGIKKGEIISMESEKVFTRTVVLASQNGDNN